MTLSEPEQAVCAVIVTYNIGNLVGRCVEPVYGQVGEVVIIDNGSERETQDELDKLACLSRIKIIRNPRNEGIARAMNQGAEYAIARGYEWVLTLDHDSEATPGMVRELLRAYEATGRSRAIFGANRYDRNSGVFAAPKDFDGGDVIEVRDTISSGSLMHRSLFKTVGFFNELLFVYYVDIDYCRRAETLGIKTYICPKALLIHSEGVSASRRFLHTTLPHTTYGKEAHYFISRNSVYMIRKYRYDPYSGSIMKRLAWDFIKVILYDKQKIQKVTYRLRGLWDGAWGTYGPL